MDARGEAGVTRVARTVLFVHDMRRALVFYRDVLGFEAEYPPSPGWASLVRGGTAIGLHDGRTDARPTENQPILYLAVEDFDRALAALRAAGRTVETHATPAGKRLGLFHDPEGNALGIEGR
jgi:predicted enzyme related to lactoylglutathione lyase